ncbi:putative nucleic-acid-binding protein [Azospirillum lipoferum]|uniref:Ribonuclease VapC n=1 Tax=Azospirillum lipoferum TaxID=193 RepID=A0A5A9GMY1_AZOLI|nr:MULTISPECIES: type II toxin-antitoxin system VapC family toxin [Azospirillum]KAA0595776.1 type II toxin-antitoxin system VapC family toxin [Azospirillum lipoferum]MCP1611352.1 putative nucleic-acid-binding protein [Azospirillum lipoferum]MDW5537156.1 type II toxin-antitoxin system VapC family toxin [Azospirillum sp. NL1]
MKIAVDTNVLVRFLTWDAPEQADEAARIIEEAETVFISTVVLCEVVWVLKRAYRYRIEDIAAALKGLIESRTVETNRAAAEAGLRLLTAGGDFADGVILYESEKAKAATLVTLDQDFAKRAGTGTVKLLTPSPAPRQ